jgi:uncharacterized membrane protein
MNFHRDLLAAAAAAVLCALVVLYVPLEGVRVVAAAPLCLLLPGYAISAAAFGRRSLRWSQLLLSSVAMSLATLALGSLVLNYVPGGLHTTSWTALLVLVVLGGCALASLRRPSPASDRLRVFRPQVRGVDRRLLVGAALAAAGGAAAVGMAVAVSWTPLPAKEAVGYTQLWMLPSGDVMQTRMQIGVVSQEQHPVAYRLKVQVGRRGAPASSRLGSRLVLEPGQRRVFQLKVRRRPSGAIPVTARLFQGDDPEVAYRRVTGWLPGRDTQRRLARGS